MTRADLRHLVESALTEWCDHLDLPDPLSDGIRYAVLTGGKRLRPILTLMACHAANGDHHAALRPALAIELVHTFSLVHDDLPAMDDDDLRRGRPTLHRHADEATAILVGDALLNLAFQMLAAPHDTTPRTPALIRELAEATTAMIAGQVHDTIGGFHPDTPPDERLAITHRGKTGALLRCACRMGAITAMANEETFEALTSYGESAGLMFQIVDDLIDVTQTTEHVGKRTSKDSQAGKITYPDVHGIEASRTAIERLRLEGHAALATLGTAADPLRTLLDDLAIRTK